MISFQKTTIEQKTAEYQAYAASLRLIDTYWEDNICSGTICEIRAEGEAVGCFSLLPEQGMLSSFFLREESRFLLRPVFRRILEEFQPKGAYIVSNDEPFFAACSDHMRRLVPHAFFFDHAPGIQKPPAFPAELLRPAEEADLPELIETGFYHPVVLHDPENQIFVLRDREGSFLGTGHIARMRLARQWGCVGMYTAPEHRQKGVGRSIILPLIEETKRQGLIPIAGCCFDNLASRHTLQSCGMFSQTRYFNLFF